MYDKRMIKIWTLAFTFGLLFSLCAQAGAAAEAEAVAVRFYGNLTDQNNEPVAGATVHALVYDSLEDKARPVRKITATTDTGGTFQLSAAGLRLDILSIKKQGYEFSTNRKKDLT